MGKGLSREVIVEAAAEAVRKNPFQQISVNELARTLGVKPASLYNHIASAEDIRTEVGLYAAGKLIRETGEAVSGKMPEDALMSFAKAYRAYERDNPGLYFYIIHLHDAEDSRLREAAAAIIQPIIEILST
ncbi:MAG: TetR/AcrR family transcriptional regulator [Clostridia bacterium]|nr:TetR/AcrR family transcriptional regulator [Clostridia bacterium]